jgi:hypothetical protein
MNLQLKMFNEDKYYNYYYNYNMLENIQNNKIVFIGLILLIIGIIIFIISIMM